MKKKVDYLRIATLLILFAGVAYFYLNLFLPRVIPNFLKIAILERPMNILILGTDIDYDLESGGKTSLGRTDTMILMHYVPLLGKINLLSIPRDSYVDIPGYYPAKINSAFVLGKADLTVRTVQQMTGVKIEKFILLDTHGLVKLIDLFGGVTVDVEKDLYYTDKAAGLYIDLKKGRQKLNGRQAEEYIRFRHDATSDLGRIARQQNFLKEMTRALSSPNALVKAPFILGIVKRNVLSNLSLKELILLGNTFRQMKLKEVNTLSLPAEPANNQAGNVLIVNQEELKKIIVRYF
jgi:polyisoprenyl-teichoic acid--peptidoglycan teichoic acid transferase